MSDAGPKRRVAAEINFEGARNPIISVGSRGVHHYWTLLAPHFRGLLLTPQRRSDDRGVAWTWQEASGAQPPTAEDLADLRKRLVAALDAFKDDPAIDSTHGKITEAVEEIVARLIKKNDAKLAAFVGRTEAGLMIHSWGATIAAVPFHPDDIDCAVSGRLLVGDKDAANLEVVLENRKGLVIARTRSEAAGNFEFKKVGAGSYRVRVVADRVDFPVSGVEVEIGRTSVTDLEVRSTALNVSAGRAQGAAGVELRTRVETKQAAAEAEAQPRPRPRRWLPGSSVAAGVVGVAMAAWWWWPVGKAPLKAAPSTGTFSAAARSPEGAGGGSDGRGGVQADRGSVAAMGGAGGVNLISSGTGNAKPPRASTPATVRKPAARQTTPVPTTEADEPGAVDDPSPDDATENSGSAKTRPLVAKKGAAEAKPAKAAPEMAAPTDASRRADPEEEPTEETPSEMATTGDSTSGRKSKPIARKAAGRPRTDDTSAFPKLSVTADPDPSAAPMVEKGAGSSRQPLAVEKAPAPSLEKAAIRPPRLPTEESAAEDATMDDASDADPAANERKADKKSQAKKQAASGKPGSTEKNADGVGEKGERATNEQTAKEKKPEKEPPAGKEAAGRGQRRRGSKPPNEVAAAEAQPTEETPSAVDRGDKKSVVARQAPARVSGGGGPTTTALGPLARLRVSAWTRALTRDAIVPTKPVLAGEDDALEMLRERMILERRDKIPATISDPRTQLGLVVVVRGESAGRLRWREGAGVATTESAGRAEIGWPAGRQPGTTEHFLESLDGVVKARVCISAAGAAEVETTADGEVFGWVGVEFAAADLAGLSREEKAMRFEWRLAGRPAMAGEAGADGRWSSEKGRRIEFPIGGAGGAGRLTLVVQDRVTGWAMSCGIQLR